jgi:hypothetical protein
MSFKQLLLLVLVLQVTFGKAQLLPKYGDSRSGTTGFQFLKIAPDARSASMGESYTAVVNDLSSVYWNPAGLTHLDSAKVYAQGGITNFYANINLQYAAVAKRIKSSNFIALHIINLSSPWMNVSTEFAPFGNGLQYKFINRCIGLSYAKILTDNFSFGVNAKYIEEGISTISAKNVVLDFGFQYDIGKANTRFAVGVSNFGSPVAPKGTYKAITFSGSSEYTTFEKINVPALFRLGLAHDLIKKQAHLLTLAAQLNHPTDNNETYSFGAEYLWNKLLFFRTGYQFGVDESGLPSFGFGAVMNRKFGGLQFDYGFANKKNLGTLHRFTLSLRLN